MTSLLLEHRRVSSTMIRLDLRLIYLLASLGENRGRASGVSSSGGRRMRMPQGSPDLCVVIEDDPATLDGMSGLLESWGCAVVAAPSQDTALKRLGAHGQGPDLIVSDYRLAEGKLGTQA